MHKNCPVCNQTYTPEPGFYFGAAYISYMISVAIGVVGFILFYFVFGWKDPWPLICGMIALAVLIAPVNFRLSRSVWAHIFIRYKPLKKG